LLDHQALSGTPGVFASAGHPDLDEWRQAVKSSAIINKIRSLPPSPGTRYLLSDVECWARSYAQWITRKNLDSPTLPESIKTTLRQGLQSYLDRPRQGGHWTDEDFAPISAALDRLFARKGWLFSPTGGKVPA
jgi:hypothetical protein